MNFTLSELIKSDTATKYNINNMPSDIQILDNMLLLITNCLQPIRDKLGKPININSGYRNLQVNRLVGGVSNSQHTKGQAVDIKVKGMTPIQLHNFIKNSGVEVDQCILEATWVHLSYKKTGNRKQYFKI